MTTRRLALARDALRAASLDALLVTHPPNIRYLTGLNATAGAVLLALDQCTLFVDFRYATAADACAQRQPGLRVVVTRESLEVAIADALRHSGLSRVGVEGDHLTLSRFARLSGRLATAGMPMEDRTQPPFLASTERVLERLRAVKDEAEVQTLREAARRLSEVAREAPGWLVPGRTEAQVAAMIDAAVREAGFERPAFDTIVASGPNAALPHARPTSRILQTGEGVVLDFGGIYDGYCVDLTRTLHIGPMPGPFRRVFEAVREAHAAAIRAVRPGVTGREIDAAARQVLESHGLGEAFGHGTGHGLGLEVHEEPRISPLAPEGEPVVVGMVFTIEPGAYLPGTGGVRIEDDILVTRDGCERLTDVPVDF